MPPSTQPHRPLRPKVQPKVHLFWDLDNIGLPKQLEDVLGKLKSLHSTRLGLQQDVQFKLQITCNETTNNSIQEGQRLTLQRNGIQVVITTNRKEAADRAIERELQSALVVRALAAEQLVMQSPILCLMSPLKCLMPADCVLQSATQRGGRLVLIRQANLTLPIPTARSSLALRVEGLGMRYICLGLTGA